MNADTLQNPKITEQDRQLIKIMREIGYGQMLVVIRDGKPAHVEEIRKSIQIK